MWHGNYTNHLFPSHIRQSWQCLEASAWCFGRVLWKTPEQLKTTLQTYCRWSGEPGERCSSSSWWQTEAFLGVRTEDFRGQYPSANSRCGTIFGQIWEFEKEHRHFRASAQDPNRTDPTREMKFDTTGLRTSHLRGKSSVFGFYQNVL